MDRWEGELSQRGLEQFEVRAEIGDLDDPAANPVHYTVTLRPQSEDSLVYGCQGGGVVSEGTLTRQG